MIHRRSLAVALVCLTIILAGCTGWGTDGPVDEDDPEPDEAGALEDAQDDTNDDADSDEEDADDAAEVDDNDDSDGSSGDDSADPAVSEDDTSSESDDNAAEDADDSDGGNAGESDDSDSGSTDDTSDGDSSDDADESEDSSEGSDDGTESDADESESDASDVDESDETNDGPGADESNDENGDESDENDTGDETDESDDAESGDNGDNGDNGDDSSNNDENGDDENETHSLTVDPVDIVTGEDVAAHYVLEQDGETVDRIEESGLSSQGQFEGLEDGEYELVVYEEYGDWGYDGTVVIDGSDEFIQPEIDQNHIYWASVLAHVEDADGEPIENETVEFTMGDRGTTLETDENGEALYDPEVSYIEEVDVAIEVDGQTETVQYDWESYNPSDDPETVTFVVSEGTDGEENGTLLIAP